MAIKQTLSMKKNVCRRCQIPITSNRKYCGEELVISCAICKKIVLAKCSNRTPETCGRSCGSKLIRKKQAENNKKICEQCENVFLGKSHNSRYCGQWQTWSCSNCNKEMLRKCCPRPTNYCSPKCRTLHMRENTYSIKEIRNCIICEKSFSPRSSRQKVCGDAHIKKCVFCEEDYEVVKVQIYLRKNNQFCDNICSALHQTQTKMPKELISEYKNPNKWASDFKEAFNRKPTFSDFKAYFGVRHKPKNIDVKLFTKVRSSSFEMKVIQHIETYFPDLMIKQRYRHKFRDGALEIDVYLPELNLGFEVQDFKTHSKIETSMLNPYGGPMRGPSYHEEKREKYSKLGVKVVDIWEDEIKNYHFKELVEQEINFFRATKNFDIIAPLNTTRKAKANGD